MNTIDKKYRITVSDFRRANYYGLFLRHKKPILFMFLIVGLGLIYLILSLNGFGKIDPLILLISTAYLTWGLYIFACQEKIIRSYIKSKDSFLRCEYRMTIDERNLRVRIQEKSIDQNVALKDLACAFEMSSLFLLYINPRDVYLLPIRELDINEREKLRSILREKLQNRFGTRFEKK